MRKNYFINIAFIFLATTIALSGFNTTQAQKTASWSPNYIFTSYNAADGLPSPEVISLETDRQGFLWAGTGAGLSRYDGYSFSNFTSSEDNHLLGVVNVIKTGTTGKLWIGAASGLYCYFENRLIKVNTEANTPQGVNDIIAEDDGSLWLATDNGPVFIDRGGVNAGIVKKLMLQNFLLPQWTEKTAPLHGPQCRFIKKAADGTIYFSHQYQLFRFTQNKIELLYTATKENDKMEYVFASSKSKVYFNTSVSGLHKIDGAVHENLQFNSLYQPGRKPASEGNWYVGSLGLVCFHPDEEFISGSIAFKDAGAQWMSAVLKRDNVIWLATHSALIKIKSSAFNLYKKNEFEDVQENFSFCETRQGKLLVGVNHGKIYDLTATGARDFLPRTLQPVQHAEVKCMYEDNRGWLWIGTGYQGLAVYKNGTTTRFSSEKNNLHDNSFSSFLATKSGRLYAIGDKGMTEISVDGKGNTLFRPYYSRPAFTQFAKFYGGIEAPDGTVWIAGEEGIRFLKNDSLIPSTLSGKNINARDIKIAADKSVWIATFGEGILCCRFDASGSLHIDKQYKEKEGLNTLQFLNLLTDKEDNIWAGSVKGITFIGRGDKQKDRLVNFTEADGFIKPGYYSMHFYQDKKGVLWAGTSSGISSFKPNELFTERTPPGIYITGIDFLNGDRKPAVNDLIQAQNSSEALSLSYKSSSVNFTYAAIDNAGTDRVHFYYKMTGLDTNWVDAGSRRNVAYHNLSPGNYVFSVKAMNEKGVVSGNSASFAFVITPPFWKTWWFRLLLFLGVLSAIYSFIRWREKNIAKREAYKTEVEKLKSVSLQNQLEVEQVVTYFAASIGNQSTIDAMLWDVAKNLIGKLGFEDCMIYLWNNDKTVLLQKAGYGVKGSMQSEIDRSRYNVKKKEGIVGATVEGKQAILVNDTSTDERYFSVDDKIRLSELCVPIIHHNEVMGAINTEHTEKGFYTGRHLQILTTIASILAEKIDMLEAEQLAREKEIEILKLSKDLSDWQIAALRAQMNPHFIFNAMNSIQQFTLKNDVDNANLYLSKFSTLLRKVLHTSQQKFISLDEEMEQLQLYLDIEKLRLGEDFTFRVNAGADIETDAIKIPGMLIQPFIENALKHGLALKEGEKILVIEFSLITEQLLRCTIRDNGIGRRKAMEVKQQQEKLLPYESKGIRLVEERLALLSKGRPHCLPLFEDLYDETGHPEGTSVTLEVPVLLPEV